ncbi:VOC family protein [Cumulibacter manganitolerans]|uniref:VOC family protein n=1 Tax=Cumulibacter manganitolerans TaxID=1884992 RepID=UPI0012971193|nr:VOC family protein [Cumulibacter manganitolerans]
MHQMIFVNLPVADVARSREFFTGLGYSFDEQMCQDGTALAMELGPNMYAMLLSRELFGTFHEQRTAAPDQVEVLTCLSAGDRDEVDALVDKAVAGGGIQVRHEENGDWMYGRSYADLDGHIWEIMWMDPQKAAAAGAFG